MTDETASGRGPELLGAAQLALSYGAAPVVFGVDLSLRGGEILAVLGPNGAGKSTLLRALSGGLAPVSGEVKLLGAPLTTLSRREIARSLAVVAQEESPAFDFSVRDVVAMGRTPHLGAWLRLAERDVAIVESSLERFALTALASRSVTELSGGERKRVALARAFAQSPKVILLDEPAAFLDLKQTVGLFERLREAVTDDGVGALVVLHDVNVATRVADRVMVLANGGVHASGAPRDVLTKAALEAIYGVTLEEASFGDGRGFFPRFGAAVSHARRDARTRRG